jgi:hypothetical protein
MQGFQRKVGHQRTGKCAAALVTYTILLEIECAKLRRGTQAHGQGTSSRITDPIVVESQQYQP